jgi:hypothetical protein
MTRNAINAAAAKGAANAAITRDEIITAALAIAREYGKQGLTLTLRQMYYQFVARGLIGSGQKSYKRIGAALTKARYAGTFPIDWIEDRGRAVAPGSFTRDDTDPDRALDEAADWLRAMPSITIARARWFGQPVHVSVWVEKEALAGIFEDTCNSLGVSWFACKGYPSVSALAAWLDHADFCCDADNDGGLGAGGNRGDQRHQGKAERAVVLYFGDHDPDGWEIPRSAERNLAKLRAVRSGPDYPIEFHRVALNMDQIEEHNPPPFEAKMTSSRYQGYRDEHGTDEAWELDALDPATLRGLIREHVRRYFDELIAADNSDIVRDKRAEVRERMQEDGWITQALDGLR